MKKSNGAQNPLLRCINQFLMVKNDRADVTQRGHFLAFVLLVSIITSLILLLINTIEYVVQHESSGLTNVLMDLLAVFSLFVLWYMNKNGQTRIASPLFLAITMLAISFSFGPNNIQVLKELYFIPIFISSFLLFPASSFLIAGIALLIYFLFWGGISLAAGIDYVYFLSTLFTAWLSSFTSSTLNSALFQARSQASQMEMLVENNPGVVYRIEFQNSIPLFTYISSQITLLTGFSPDQWRASSRAMLGRIDSSDQPSVMAAMKQALETKTPYSVEYRFQTAGGTWIWLSDTAQVIATENGHVRYQGILLNITEKKTMSRLLQESEELYHSLTAASPDAIIKNDPAGVLQYASPRALQIFGYNEEDSPLGTTINQYIAPEDFPRILNMIHSHHEGKVMGGEFTFIRKDASQFFGEVHTTAIHNSEGKVISFISILRDVTERREADTALRNSEERYRIFFNSANLGMFQTTLDGKIIDVNPELLRIFHFENLDVALAIHSVADQIYHNPAVREEIIALLHQNNRIDSHEIIFRRTDGSTFTGRVDAWPLRDAGGNINRIEGFIEDISAKLKAEQAMRNRLQIEEILSTISTRFISINSEHIDAEISVALESIGNLVKADHCYIHLVNDNKLDTDKVHEWENPVHSDKRKEDPYPLSTVQIDATLKQIASGDFVYIPSTTDPLRKDFKELKIFREAGIQSFFIAPLIADNFLFGYFGFHNHTVTMEWSEEDLKLFKLAGEIFTNVFLQKRVEDALREAYQLNAEVIAGVKTGICVLDQSLAFVIWNPIMEQMTGIPAVHMIGRRIQTVFPKVIDHNLETQMLNALKGETIILADMMINIEETGRRGWATIYLSPHRDAWGDVIGIIVVVVDVNDRKNAEAALISSENQYHTTLDALTEWIYVIDQEYRVILINHPAALILRRLGLSTDVNGKHILEVFPYYDQTVMDEFQKVFETGQIETSNQDAVINGFHFRTETTRAPIMENGQVARIISVVRDVHRQKEVEEQLLAAVNEKEVLLREIHHRVKNNLQVMSSLLSLQADTITDLQARAALKESQTRVNSMAFVHEEMYKSSDLSRIDFASYIRRLTSSLFYAYAINPNVTLEIDIDEVYLSVETAIPCGLMINELIANSLKYAFPFNAPGKIRVAMKPRAEKEASESYELVVEDNGIGLPEGLDLTQAETLGLQLVQILTRQLHGKLTVHNETGAQFIIHFSEKKRA